MVEGAFARQTLRKGTAPVEAPALPGRKLPCQNSGNLPRSKARDGRPAPRLFGVVSHASTFGPTVDNDDRGVHIEDEGVALIRQSKQIGAQAVVKTYQLSNAFGSKALQEAAQRALVGESLQPQHLQKSAVVLKDVGLVDAAQSHNDGEEQGHNQLGRVIRAGAATHVDIALDQAPQPQLVAKTLNEPHTTKVGKLALVEGKTDQSSAFWHVTQSTLLGVFVSRSFLNPNYTILRSENYQLA